MVSAARNQTGGARAAVALAVILGVGGLLLVIRQPTALSELEEEAAAEQTIVDQGPAYPSPQEIAKHWPRFRGPGGQGVSAYPNAPTTWDGAKNEGILWKAKIERPGESSPIVWGKRVFISGGDEEKRQIYCYDAEAGTKLWTADLESPAGFDVSKVRTTDDTGWAAPTMVTDGRRVYAVFATGDLGAFDFHGKLLWSKNLGLPKNQYGYASSPVMYQNLLVVLYDQQDGDFGKSKLLAFNGADGNLVWDMSRQVTDTWATPIVIQTAKGDQLITCSNPWINAYDPATGKELWRADLLGADVAPSPVFAAGMVFAILPWSSLYAIRPDGQEDVTETHLAWEGDEGIADMCSPVSNGDLIFLVSASTVTCYGTADGALLWAHEFDADFLSSPTLVDDAVYLMSRAGEMFIFKAARAYQQLGKAHLHEPANTSPAFLDARIYIRAKEHLYCIGQK